GLERPVAVEIPLVGERVPVGVRGGGRELDVQGRQALGGRGGGGGDRRGPVGLDDHGHRRGGGTPAAVADRDHHVERGRGEERVHRAGLGGRRRAVAEVP